MVLGTEPTRQIRAQEGPQRAFLQTPAEIAGYGGSAFGGKTWALLFGPLKHVLDPKFRGVIFRQTFPQIVVGGGLWDESMEIYPLRGGVPFKSDLSWRFPSGAIIKFHHLQEEKTKYDWQGSQIPYFGFDELTHFSESVFTYVAFSRGRTNCTVQPYIRCTCNPDPGWVKSFFAPWVDDQHDGIRAKSGEILWFNRVDGKIVFSRERTEDGQSITFIRARITDNKIGLEKNPRYLPKLKGLPPVERARLLDGDWNVRREGLVYEGFDSCIVESMPGPYPAPAVGGIDYGFHNPFAAVWGHLDGDDVLWITGTRSVRQTTIPVHAEAIPKGVSWWADPAQPESTAQLRDRGHQVLPCVHRPVRGANGEMKKPILSGVDMVSERIRTGRLRIVRPACLPLIRSLSTYHYDETKQQEEPVKLDDHECDALRYLIVGLDRHRGPIIVETEAARRAADEDIRAHEQAEADRLREEQVELNRKRHEDFDDETWWEDV
jgi:Terminase large subunit, T4likevirus-type, N-terminal